MKPGSLNEGGSDGTLIVVGRDLTRAVRATLKIGDWVRIEILDAEGDSIFGVIEQTVEQYAS